MSICDRCGFEEKDEQANFFDKSKEQEFQERCSCSQKFNFL